MSYFDALAEHSMEPVEVSGGRELVIVCPLCQDRTARLYVNAETGAWICHHCDERGGSYRLLRVVLELDHFRAMRLRDQIEGKRERKPPVIQPVKADDAEGIAMPPGINVLTDPSVEEEWPYWDYLGARGVTMSDVRKHRMGYAAYSTYAYRVVIPIFTGGTLWSFVARTISDQGRPKALHPHGGKPSRGLFNADLHRGSLAFLTEGVFDALKLGPDAMSLQGTHLSRWQRNILADKGVNTVFIMFDGDEAGRTGALTVAEELSAARFDTHVVNLPDGMDPDSAPRAVIEDAVLESANMQYEAGQIDVMLQTAVDRLDVPAPMGYALRTSSDQQGSEQQGSDQQG